MSNILKLTSRKFLVALGALAALFTSGESPVRLAVIAGVAGLYIFAEAYLDARGLGSVARDVAGAVQKGLATGAAATSEPAVPPPAEESTTTFLGPAKSTILPPLPEDLRS